MIARDKTSETNAVHVNNGGLHHCPSHYVWNTKGTEKDWDLWFFSKGRGRVFALDRTYECLPGSCFIFRPWENNIFRSDSRLPPSIYWIHYDYLDRDRRIIEPTDKTAPPFYRLIPECGFMVNLLDRLFESWQKEEDTASNGAHFWLGAVLREINRSERLAQAVSRELEQARLFRNLCAEMSEFPNVTYTAQNLASRFHVSPDHFARLFKKRVGMSPREYEIHMRIEAAKKLLATTSKKVSEVAADLGYCDLYFFCKQFRNKTGLTPNKFRKSAGHIF